IQAAIGIHQLARVERSWERRREIWQRYQRALASLPLGLPREPEADTRHSFHLYTIRIDAAACGIDRDTFLERMNSLRVGTGVHYLALPEHPYYQETFSWRPEQWPNATRIGRETAS